MNQVIRVPKVSPIEFDLGRPYNTEVSNLLSKQISKNFSDAKNKSIHINNRALQNAVLTPRATWENVTNSGANLNIGCKRQRINPLGTSKSESDNAPLGSVSKRGSLIHSKFTFQLGDKRLKAICT